MMSAAHGAAGAPAPVNAHPPPPPPLPPLLLRVFGAVLER